MSFNTFLRSTRRLSVVASLAGLLASCTALPATAPTSVGIEALSPTNEGNHFIVYLNPAVISMLGDAGETIFTGKIRAKSYKPNLALHAGDIVNITIFESSGPSIFAPYSSSSPTPGPSASTPVLAQTASLQPQSKTTSLPPVVIEANGMVSLPFAGAVRLAGTTPGEAGKIIEQALEGKAINPKVLVSLAANVSNIVTVGGDVNRPSSFNLSLRGENLLDLIGQAGGSKWPPFDTDVRLIRDNEISTVKLQQIIDNPSQNIKARPNDQIFLLHNPMSFAVLGAAQKVSQYTFDTAKVSLAEAISRAGGPIDSIGTPGALYLFREEPLPIMKDLVATGQVFNSGGARLLPDNFYPTDAKYSILYKIDLNEAEGYFLARKVYMKNRDVILMANSEGAQLLKLLTIARGVTGAIGDVIKRY